MNILLIDDQPNILSSLVSGINWQELGFTSVFTAVNAATARLILMQNEIDIVVSDIEMPKEDGLSLLAWARQQGYDYECILLSAHADFFYAQRAIPLRVSDYVVQPARNEDIIRAVNHAIDARLHSDDQQTNTLPSYNPLDELAQNTALKTFFELWPRTEVLVLDPDKLQDIAQKLNDMGIMADPHIHKVFILYFHVISWHALPLSQIDFLKKYHGILWEILPETHGKKAFFSRNENTYFTVLFVSEVSDTEIKLKKIKQEIEHRLGCSIRLFYTLTDFPSLRNGMDLLLEEDEKYIVKKSSAEEDPIKVYFDLYAVKNGADNSYSFYARLIDQYIANHISESITRTQIADELHLSADYISFIVRNVFNLTCKELITSAKMKHARNMLKYTERPVGDVAQACGYDNFAYFSKVYKDTFGITPSMERN